MRGKQGKHGYKLYGKLLAEIREQTGALLLKHLSPSGLCFKVEGTLGFLAKPTVQLCSFLPSQEGHVPKLPHDIVCFAWSRQGGTENWEV